MAYADQTNQAKTSLLGGFSLIISALATRFARYRVFVETKNELNALSGRELADLGLHRSMIKRIALDAAYGEK